MGLRGGMRKNGYLGGPSQKYKGKRGIKRNVLVKL